MTQDLTGSERVLELGPGTGVFTRAILRKGVRPDRFTLVEIDEELASLCRSTFPELRVLTMDVEDALQQSSETYDVIISGIPFALMDREKRHRVFRHIRNRLSPGGTFLMFQYSLATRRDLEQIFDHVDIRFTPWNVPPAFVYVCKQKPPDTSASRG